MKRMWSKNELKAITKALIESGLIENAKPIYKHTITITGSALSFSMELFLNNKTQITTVSNLVNLIKDKALIRIQLNGCYYTSDFYFSPSFLLTREEVIYLIGIDSVGDIHDTTTNQIVFDTLMTSLNITTCYDSVEKLN